MKTKSKQELLREIEWLQEQLSEAKETLRAISNGEIDAVAVDLTERKQAEETRICWPRFDKKKNDYPL